MHLWRFLEVFSEPCNMQHIVYIKSYEFLSIFGHFVLTNDKWGRVDGKNTVGEKDEFTVGL